MNTNIVSRLNFNLNVVNLAIPGNVPLTTIEKCKSTEDASLLWLQELIKFAMINGGKQHVNVIDSIVAHAISPESGVCDGLNAKDAEDISSLLLEVKFLSTHLYGRFCHF